MTRPLPDPEFDVPADRPPEATCPYCERPFAAQRACALHVGEVHGEVATGAERTAYEEAREDERADLFYFHLKAVAALGAIYAMTVLLYMIALGSGLI